MKRVLIIIFMICILTQAFGVKISSWKSKNKKGQEVITEKYRNEPDGKVKVVGIGENGVEIERTIYYKDNKEYKEKEIGFYENGKIKIVHTYYFKNSPDYSEYTLSENTSEGTIMTTHYRKNPKDYLTYKQIEDKAGNKLKDELIYDRTEGCIKEDIYYENNEIKRIEYFYKNDKSYMTYAVTYYKSFKDIDNNVRERDEFFYENDPETLIKIIKYYDENGIKRLQEQFYSNPSDGIFKVLYEFTNGKASKAITYDKDGNILKVE